ncbi:hypothetical protein QQ045_021191 [Rhodiola kirilowii]
MTTPRPVTPYSIVDEPYMYGKLPTKVFLVDFALDLGLQKSEVVEEIDGYKFVVSAGVHNRSVNFCTQGVCQKVHETSLLHFETLGDLMEGYDILWSLRAAPLLLTWLNKPPRPPETSGNLISYIVHLVYDNGGLKILLRPSSNTRDFTLFLTMSPFIMQAPTERISIVSLVGLLIRGVSATVSQTCTAPVDYAKFLIQNQDELVNVGKFSEPHNEDVKIYCPAIDKQHVPVDILSKVLRKQNNNKTILMVDLGGSTSDACDFEFILMLKVAGYWSLALSSIQKGLALLIDNSSQVLPTEFYGKCTLDMPPYAVIDEVITLEEHFYRPRTYDIGVRFFLELLLPNEQIVLKRVRVFIFYTEPIKLTYDIIISATATEGTSSANSIVTIDPTYKFLNDDVTMVVVAVHTCFNIFQREASKGARRMAGLEVSRGIGEHTVIFMEYKFEKKNSGAILAFDPGGGTLNVSVHKEFVKKLSTVVETQMPLSTLWKLLMWESSSAFGSSLCMTTCTWEARQHFYMEI